MWTWTGHIASAQEFTSVPFATITRQNTVQTDGFQTVVRESGVYAALWARYFQGESRPEVDFRRSMVAAMFLGPAGNGCYTASVNRVLQRRGATRIEYVLENPDPMLSCTAMIVYPSVWVEIPKMSGKVIFIRVDRP